ncbi:MAG: protein BatD [Bacteroidetes bacterium]|nr:protein BatD [Bacteroidota bacterium]
MRSKNTYTKKIIAVVALHSAIGLLSLPFGKGWGWASDLYAQKFTASVNKNRVAVGEVFQLDFSINANGRNFTPPSFGDFTVYSGPNQSTSMQIVNGNMSQSITLSYYLAAKKEGTFTIGAASIIVGNNTLQSNAINIEAVKSGNTQQQAQPQQQNGTKGKNSSQGSSENIFSRTSVSKSKVYAGEQIVITHKVYTRMNLKGFQSVKFPSYNGFWMQEVPRNAQYEIKAENVDGVNYNVVEVKKAFLFAQRIGKIEIEPMEIECVIREKSGRRNDPFSQIFGNDPFFGFDSYKDVVYNVKSNAVTIDVASLPEAGKPADFPGAVGNFSMNATIDKDKVKANNGINLKITISGKGNLKLIDAPKMNFPDEFETYDPKTNENIAANENGVSGSKIFEYLLIPRHEGIYKIEPWKFNYFDAEKKTYVALPSKEFTVTVEKGDGGISGAMPVFSSVSKEDVKIFGNDIRYIKTDNVPLSKQGEYFFSSPLFIAGFSVPPLLFLAFLFLRREHIRRNSDLAMVRKRGAGRIAKKQLAQAEKSMKASDKENFFVNILSALYSYAGNKMNIPVAELSKEKVVELLREKNVQEDTINELVKLLDECEFARYAPGLQSGNLQEVYDRAANIITKIENAI